MMMTFAGHQGHGGGLPATWTDVGVPMYEASGAADGGSPT